MDFLVTALLSAAAWLVAIPAIMFAVQTIAGCLPRGRIPARSTARTQLAVLMPAHDEEAGIVETLSNIAAQLRTGDRLVVVADNCSDRTAAWARALGAEVVERHDQLRRGKGFALDAGVRYLSTRPPELVVIIDADCMLEDGALDYLAQEATRSGKPVQACYLMQAPAGSGIGMRVAELAFLIKNFVRPRGLRRLGLPCQLTGSGMALPWKLIGQANLAHRGIVEDMQLGLDLAEAGFPPVFCEWAVVSSVFPSSQAGAITQRQRWEGGHLAMIARRGSALLDIPALQNPALLALTLDLMVPPLTLLILLVVLLAGATGIAALIGFSPVPFMMSIGLGATLTLGGTLAWFAYGQKILPASKLLGIPAYVIGKLWFYPRVLMGKFGSEWIRTDRSKPADI